MSPSDSPGPSPTAPTASAVPDGPPPDEHNPSGKTFFGQPRPLANLFNVELWERFSFYGMQGILALYMYYATTEGGLGLDPGIAAGVVGAYGGSVYIFSILGGLVADRILGPERTLTVSALMIMAGHLALAVLPGVPGLVLGLILVGVGSGGLKATAATLVGSLYDLQDTRRDAGFSIFYMGVNVGGLIGPLLTGWAQQAWGFHLGFGLAAVGMAIGLVQYLLTRRNLPATAAKVPDPLPRRAYPLWIATAVLGILLIVLLVLTGVITVGNLSTLIVALSVIAAVAIFAMLLISRKVTADERSRVVAFIPLFIGTAAFFALFQQQFTVVTIYSDFRLDRDVLGWTIPVPWVQSFNPLFIILLSPLFALLWTRLGRRQPMTPVKFAVGIMLIGAAFLLFLPMASVAAVPVLWIAFILLVATMGELMLSPVGLSLSTKLAPQAFPVMMMALYYLSVALGTALSGSLAQFYSEDDEVAYFGVLGAVTIVIGLVMLAISKPVAKAMRGVR